MDLLTACTDLAALMTEAKRRAAAYDAQIRALEIARADALAPLTFQIETLQATLRPLLLADGHTQKVAGLTATIVHKTTWDHATLQAIAQEIPSILQAQRDSSYVSFRLTTDRKERATP